MFRVYLGTQSGAYRLNGGKLSALGLENHTISVIYASNFTGNGSPEHDTVLAGSYGEGLETPSVESVCFLAGE